MSFTETITKERQLPSNTVREKATARAKAKPTTKAPAPTDVFPLVEAAQDLAEAPATVEAEAPATPTPVAPAAPVQAAEASARPVKEASYNLGYRIKPGRLDQMERVLARCPGVKSKQDLMDKIISAGLDRLEAQLSAQALQF